MKKLRFTLPCALVVGLFLSFVPSHVHAEEGAPTAGGPWVVAQVEYPSSRQRELEQPSYRQQQLEGVQEPPPPQYGQQPAYNYNQQVYEENLQRRGVTTQRLRGTRYYR